MSENIKEYIVEGYVFYSEKEALLAQKELEGIKYLRRMNNMNNTKVMYQVYHRIIAQKLFVTPIGIDYLKSLQRKLRLKYSAEEIKPIPIIPDKIDMDKAEEKYKTILPKLQDVGNDYKRKLKVSWIVNGILIVMIIIMFIIASTTNNPNILNYENALIDRYEHWEKELTEREEALNERENFE